MSSMYGSWKTRKYGTFITRLTACNGVGYTKPGMGVNPGMGMGYGPRPGMGGYGPHVIPPQYGPPQPGYGPGYGAGFGPHHGYGAYPPHY